MTPQEQELVKKLAEQVNNIAHLVAGTEAGESQTLKEIRDLVYRLNKGMDENSTIETAKRFLYDGNHNFIERELINFYKRTIKEFEENELKNQPKIDTERQSFNPYNHDALNPPY